MPNASSLAAIEPVVPRFRNLAALALTVVGTAASAAVPGTTATPRS